MPVSVAISGHQPFVLGGHSPELESALRALAGKWLTRNRPDEVVSGLAAGWDMACAHAALELGVPLVAALAYPGQGENWPVDARVALEQVISASAEVVTLSPEKMDGIWTRRDQWVMGRATRVLALWNGGASGTGRAIAYAESIGLQVENLWGEWMADPANQPSFPD